MEDTPKSISELIDGLPKYIVAVYDINGEPLIYKEDDSCEELEVHPFWYQLMNDAPKITHGKL